MTLHATRAGRCMAVRAAHAGTHSPQMCCCRAEPSSCVLNLSCAGQGRTAQPSTARLDRAAKQLQAQGTHPAPGPSGTWQTCRRRGCDPCSSLLEAGTWPAGHHLPTAGDGLVQAAALVYEPGCSCSPWRGGRHVSCAQTRLLLAQPRRRPAGIAPGEVADIQAEAGPVAHVGLRPALGSATTWALQRCILSTACCGPAARPHAQPGLRQLAADVCSALSVQLPHIAGMLCPGKHAKT